MAALVLAVAGLLLPETGHAAPDGQPDGRSDIRQAPAQRQWHATLDLRTLPAATRPTAIHFALDASDAARSGQAPRITVSLNGIVIAATAAKRSGPTRLSARVENRLLSTRNRVDIAVTATAPRCAVRACDLSAARLIANPVARLGYAQTASTGFSAHITRFRAGIAVTTERPGDGAFADRGIAALAPDAPRRDAGPARIVVSRKTPAGTAPALRFDTGDVHMEDEDGRLLYDGRQLDALTVVQLVEAGPAPVLWIRPGRDAPPPPVMDLDYGSLALFDAQGRVIALDPATDAAARIVYAQAAGREARLALYTRLALAAFWLLASIGFVFLIRRLPPLLPAEAGAAA